MSLIETTIHRVYRFKGRYKTRVYLHCNYWNSDVAKTLRLYHLLKKSGRYSKVTLHKNCVYATQNCMTQKEISWG